MHRSHVTVCAALPTALTLRFDIFGNDGQSGWTVNRGRLQLVTQNPVSRIHCQGTKGESSRGEGAVPQGSRETDRQRWENQVRRRDGQRQRDAKKTAERDKHRKMARDKTRKRPNWVVIGSTGCQCQCFHHTFTDRISPGLQASFEYCTLTVPGLSSCQCMFCMCLSVSVSASIVSTFREPDLDRV